MRAIRLFWKRLNKSHENNNVNGKRRKRLIVPVRSVRSRLAAERLEDRLLLSGDFAFAEQLGGTGNDGGRSIATDAAGNVYTTGFFGGTADFNPGAGTFNLTSAGGNDVFVSKVDSAGNFVWANALGGTSYDHGHGIAVDGLGNVYTTGFFESTADFDPGPGTFNLISAGLSDTFISKLDGAGNFVWAKALGGAGDGSGSGIAVDGFRNVYTTGYFVGTADFDPGVGTFNMTSAGGNDVFVSKLDSSGNFVWAKALGGASGDTANGIALDGLGNVYTIGNFNGTGDYDPGSGTSNLISAGNDDVFISKLDSAGNFVWAKAFSGGNDEIGQGIAVDGLGNVYTTGYFFGTADFDPGAGTFNLTSVGNFDIFVSKLDSAGNFVWAKGLGGTIGAVGYGMAVDGLGNVYTTGYFVGIVDFDPGARTFNLTSASSAGNYDIFVSKLDSAGNFVWAKALGGINSDYGQGIAVDGFGNVYTTGNFLGTANFDPGAGTFDLSSVAGSNDVFVSKLTQDLLISTPLTGAVNWVLRRHGANIQIFDAVANAVIDQRTANLILGVQVNGAGSAIDNLTVDFQFGGSFSFPNGIRFIGNTGSDVLNVVASIVDPQDIIYRPSTISTGISLLDVSGSVIQFSGVESAVVSKVRELKIETQGSTDFLNVSAATGFAGAAGSKLSGTSNGVSIKPITWSDTSSVRIDTGAKDGAAGAANDTLTFATGSLDAVGMKNLSVETGKGADILTVNSADLGLPVAGGSFWFFGG
ncbi:MAG: SBBP repeat-containing protein, partial [Pirellulaceae bacterium]